MESNIDKPHANSDPVDKENKNLYYFRSQLTIDVESEWAKTSTNALEKKKLKRNKGKSAKENQQRKALLQVVGNFDLWICCMIVC